MQQDQPHACIHMIGDTLNDFVRNVTMRRVTPPQQYVSVGKAILGQTVFGVSQRGRGGGDPTRCIQRRSNRAMHPVGVQIRDNLIGLLMDILAPDNSLDDHIDTFPNRFGLMIASIPAF
jgi:hypothetical protein